MTSRKRFSKVFLILLGATIIMSFVTGCSSQPANQGAKADGAIRELGIVEERIGANLSEYGVVVKSYSSDAQTDPAVYIELKVSDSKAADELRAIAASRLSEMDFAYEIVPPLNGHEIRADLDAMAIKDGYSRIIAGKEVRSISVFMVFADSDDGEYLFYIG